MKKLLRYINFTAIIACLSIFTACASLVNKGGQVLDGTAFKEKELSIFRVQKKSGTKVRFVQNKNKEEYITISVDTIPMLIFKGTLPDADGRFYIISFSFLCSNLSGWNEFTMDISGTGTFIKNGTHAQLKINQPLEMAGISSGKILRNSKKIVETQAVTALRNRQERIEVLTEWMHTQTDIHHFNTETEFELYWKPILMPELVSNKKRPHTWTTDNVEWVKAEDIKWNITYTQNIFPEDMHILRNTGALLRDWEEALSWIYLQYEWNTLSEMLDNQITLTKFK